MAQSFSEAARELGRVEESEAIVPASGIGGAAVGVAPGMQPERPVMRPSREVELTLARLDWRLVAIPEMDPQAVSQFTRLAISLIAGSSRRTMKRVLLPSAPPGQVRPSATLNLAHALARARQRTLVIDTDLRRPSIGRLLGLESEIGLAEAAALGLRAEEAIIRVMPADFHVMLTRGQVDNSAELLVSPN